MKNRKSNFTAKSLVVCIMALILTLTAATSVFALTPVEGHDFCYYNYQCNKSVYEVTIDGVYDENEWADAVELVINDSTLEEYGRWQSKGTSAPEDLSCTYRFKWDEKNLYMVEIRTDSHYVSAFGDKDHGGGACYSLDGTAIRFVDTADLTTDNIFLLEYNSFVDEVGAPTVKIYGSGDNVPFEGPSGTDGFAYAGKINGDNTVTFEIQIPWEFLRDQNVLDSDIKEGTTFRFTPIIMSRDSIEDYSTWDGKMDSFRQINFHDCVRIPESGQTKLNDPNYYALFSLSAPAVEETVVEEPVVEEPAVEEPIVTPAVEETVSTPVVTEQTKAPQTFDAGIAALAIVCASCASAVVLKKKAK